MIWEKPYWPFLEAGDDFSLCADYLEFADYEEEFCVHLHIAPQSVEEAVLAGFFPMAALAGSHNGVRPVFMPKLHRRRCLLHPDAVRVTRTAYRESTRYGFSVNADFGAVVSRCAETHGKDWLVDDLARAFVTMHENRSRMRVKMVSAELYLNDALVAGEIGYCAGKCYASLTGFRTLSGSGTVQMAALGRFLSRSGFTLWDLGMPEPDYKLRLGGRIQERTEWLKAVREAYALEDAGGKGISVSRANARDMLGIVSGPA